MCVCECVHLHLVSVVKVHILMKKKLKGGSGAN